MAAEGDRNIKIQGSVRLVGESPSSITPQSSTTANRSETSTSIMEITTTTASSRRVKQTTPREPQQVRLSLNDCFVSDFQSCHYCLHLIRFEIVRVHSVLLSTSWISIIHLIIRLLQEECMPHFIVSLLSSPWDFWPKNWRKISPLFHLWEQHHRRTVERFSPCNQMWHSIVCACVYAFMCACFSDNHRWGPPSSLSVLHEQCSICRSILLLRRHNVRLNNTIQNVCPIKWNGDQTILAQSEQTTFSVQYLAIQQLWI